MEALSECKQTWHPGLGGHEVVMHLTNEAEAVWRGNDHDAPPNENKIKKKTL